MVHSSKPNTQPCCAQKSFDFAQDFSNTFNFAQCSTLSEIEGPNGTEHVEVLHYVACLSPPSPRLRRDFSEVRLRSSSFDGIPPELNAKAIQRRWTLAEESFAGFYLRSTSLKSLHFELRRTDSYEAKYKSNLAQ